MESRTLEINVVSASDLNDVNLLTKMDVYVVVSLSGDAHRRQKAKTPVDRDCGKNPNWSFSVKFTVDEIAAKKNRLTLVFTLRCERALGDKDIGQVHVPVMELLGSTGDGKSMQHVSYQVRTPSGKAQGVLNFSYKFGEKSGSGVSPVVGPAAGTSSVSYGSAAYPPPPPEVYPYPAKVNSFHSPAEVYPNPSKVNSYPPPPEVYPNPSKVNSYPPPTEVYPNPSKVNSYPPPTEVYPNPSKVNSYPPPEGYPQVATPPPAGTGHAYYPPPAPSYNGQAGPFGYPHQQPPPPPPYAYGYPPQPGYGYPPPPAGYGVYPPPVQQQQKKNNKLGMGLGAGLVGGMLGGLLIGDLVSDGFDDAGGFF